MDNIDNNSERIRPIQGNLEDGNRIVSRRRIRTRTRNENATAASRRRLLVLLLTVVRFVPFIDAFVSLNRYSSRTCSPHQKKHVCLSTSSPEQSSTSGRERNKSYVNSKRQQIKSSTSSNTTSTATVSHPANKNGNLNPNRNRNRNRKRYNGNQNHDNRNSIRIMFQTAKTMERQGRWGEAHTLLEKILKKNPKDSHSHLAIARLEARREGGQGANRELSRKQEFPTKAQVAFERGTKACPQNIFLLQAWAIYEQQNRGDMKRSRELFDEAVAVDPHNPYVCHAYSLMEKKLGNDEAAISLLKQVLDAPSAKVTAALVCTLGEIYIAAGNLTEARALYQHHVDKIESSNMANANQLRRRQHLPTEKDRVEVYLAAAWLEERHFRELRKARDLLRKALAISPTSSLANVALARLEGRIQAGDSSSGLSSVAGQSAKTAKFRTNLYNTTEAANRETAKRLATICDELHQQGMQSKNHKNKNQHQNHDRTSPSVATNEDGRVFNALATLEVKNRRFREARDVLQKGMDLYPLDHNLFTAAGKVEERVGNYTRARDLYMESLRLEPSAPTLVAFALLELKHPQYPTTTSTETTIDKKVIKVANFTLIRGLFEEALMLDPRNGPAYNAYGNAEARRGNIEEARLVFERGTRANCSDAASIYHGYGMLEISVGNVEKARSILYKGLENVREHQDAISSDNPNRDRAAFLSHTLGMLELNSNRASSALKIFQEGIERCGNSSQLLLGAALSEMRLGKDEAARNLFERSVYADKKHAQAWQAWGVMETKAGHFNHACALFQKGIKHAPWHGSLWHGYASLEVRRDNIANARTLFKGGLKKAKNRLDALYQGWATLEMREGNIEKARKLISEALTRNKQNGRGWIIAAQIEEEAGNDGLSLLMLRRGIECDPDNSELYRKLGDHLLGKGKIDDAREIYEKGIESNEMYAPLYHSLAELEARICNLDALARLNKRTNELFNNNAMEPSPGSYQALEKKLKNSSQNRPVSSFFVDRNKQQQMSASQGKPRPPALLSEKIVIDGDDENAELDPSDIYGNSKRKKKNLSDIEELNGEGIVGDIMSVESILNDTTTKMD